MSLPNKYSSSIFQEYSSFGYSKNRVFNNGRPFSVEYNDSFKI